MNIISAFIYGMLTFSLLSNLVYMVIDARRNRKDFEELNKMDEHIQKDLEIGLQYIKISEDLERRITALEKDKDTKKTKKAKTENI